MKLVRRLMLAMLAWLLLTGSLAAAPYANLEARDAEALIEKDPQLFLLDVRTPGEYRQVRLDGATLIPIDQLLARQKELPRDRPILVYCAVGSRSTQVAAYLAQQGYPQVYNLQGGIWSWQLRNLPVLQGLP